MGFSSTNLQSLLTDTQWIVNLVLYLLHHLCNGVIGFYQRCPQLLGCSQWVWLFFKKRDLCCWLSLALVPLCSSFPTLLVIWFWRSFPNNKVVRSDHVSSSLNELTIFMAQQGNDIQYGSSNIFIWQFQGWNFTFSYTDLQVWSVGSLLSELRFGVIGAWSLDHSCLI